MRHRRPISRVWVAAAVAASTAAVVLTGCGAGERVARRPPPASTPAPLPLPQSRFAHPIAAPAAADSDALRGSLVDAIRTHFGAVAVNELPILTVGPSVPRIELQVLPGCGDFRSQVGTVPIPAEAYTTDSHYQHDSALVVVQPSSHTAWELWRATAESAGSWAACWGGRLDTATSSGVFPFPYGLSASGISYLATTITEADVQHGSIDHTLALDVPSCDGWVPPADRGDCGHGAGAPPEGAVFRLPANQAEPSNLTPFGAMVFDALKRYGAVVTDQAGAVAVQAEDHRDWAAEGLPGTDPITRSWAGRPEYAVLAGIPWTDLQVVAPS